MQHLSSADFEQDHQHDLPQGRGHRQRQETSRIQAWRESIARSNAQRARRAGTTSESAPTQPDENTPPMAAPTSVNTNPGVQPMLTQAELDEITQDPEADLDEATVAQVMPNNIQVEDPIPLVTRRNPNLIRRAPRTPALPHPPTPIASDRPRRPLVRRSGFVPSGTATTATSTSGQISVAPIGDAAAPSLRTQQVDVPVTAAENSALGKRGIVEVPDDTDDEGPDMAPTADSSKKAKSSRPKVSDIADQGRKGLVTLACQLYRILISCEEAFPAVDAEDMAGIAFAHACTLKGVTENTVATDQELKTIKARASQVRGEIVTIARARAKTSFGFLDNDNNEATVQKNREIYAKLTDRSAFVFKNPDTRAPGTMFRNQLIQDVLNQAFFRNAKDEGIVYGDHFDAPGGGIPLPTIALIVTAIDCAISEFKTGIHEQQEFSEKAFSKRYATYLQTLKDWKEYTSKRGTLATAKLQRDMRRLARLHAGVSAEDDINLPLSSGLGITDFEADEEAA